MRQINSAVVAILAMAMMLAGCGVQQYVDLSEKALDAIPDDVGRFSAHVAVRRAEEKTKQKVAEAKKAEADAERAEEEKILVIDSIEKYAIHALSQANKTLGKVAVALARKDGNEFELATTPTPKGVVAETIDSTGNALQKVGNTPGVVAGVVGGFMAKLGGDGIEGAGDKTTTSGEGNQVSLEKTNTSTITQNTNTGTDGIATGTTAGQAAENTRSDDNSVTDTQP